MNKVFVTNNSREGLNAVRNKVIESFGVHSTERVSTHTVAFEHEHYSGAYVYADGIFAKVGK